MTRPVATPRWRVTLLAWAIVGALATGVVVAQTVVPYTVQVAALSDPDAAVDLSTRLLREGFPAYVVRAEGAAGTVFRVRVAAFGDRDSAERYASEMSESIGIEARPALAEAIPIGILPLAPTTWFRVEDGRSGALVRWGETGRAARVAGADGEPARYLLASGEAFDAWWAQATADGGRDEWVRVALDAETTSQDEASVREALFRQRVRLVAERSGLDAETLISEAVRGEVGARTLVLWRSVPASGEPTIRGVARRAADATSREAGDWLGEPPPAPAAPLLAIEAGGLEPATDGVSGDGWRAEEDGVWSRLEVGTTTWRALVGTPRAALGDVLIVRVAGALEAVLLRPR